MGRTLTTGKVQPIKKVWLSKEEAMNFLGCTERFLRTIREKAEISYSRYGNTVWYELKSLERFVNRNKVI